MAPLAQKVKSICLHVKRSKLAIKKSLRKKIYKKKITEKNSNQMNAAHWMRYRTRGVVELQNSRITFEFFYLHVMSMVQPIVSQGKKIRPIALLLPAVRNKDEVSIESPFFCAQLMRLDRLWCHSYFIKVDDASESPSFKRNKLATVRKPKKPEQRAGDLFFEEKENREK